MATEKKTAATEGLSVEERLKTLYQLQTLLSQIDRIKNLRGELPLEVKDMDDEVERLKTRIQKFKNEAEELRKGVAAKKVEIQNAQDAIAKYTEQQNNVRNNKEFDFLAKEIGFKQLEIELAEKRIREYTEMANRKADDIKSTQETMEDNVHILAEKKSELSEIISETKQDEEKLREQAKALEEKIEPRLLKAFKRIRENARNGLGIVYVQRNACGGCFNRIPAPGRGEASQEGGCLRILRQNPYRPAACRRKRGSINQQPHKYNKSRRNMTWIPSGLAFL
jgi:predicted  nucleic acid-binding Zn-ribbon protein